MAAKKNAAKGGAGYRQCPICKGKDVNSFVKGARTKACPDCGYEFPAKEKGAAKSKSSAPDLEKKAMEFVLFHQGGNLDKALKAVEAYSEDSLAKFIGDCGGSEKAKELLQQLAGKQGAK